MSGRTLDSEAQSKLALLVEVVEAAAFQFKVGRARDIADDYKLEALFKAAAGQAV
jgi:hypothetical protein